jgi:transposase
MKDTHRLTEADIATIVRRRTAGVDFAEIAEGLSAKYEQVRQAYVSYIYHLQLPPKVIHKHRLIEGTLALAILSIVKEDPFLEFTKIAEKLKQHDPPFETIPHRTSIQRYLARAGWNTKEAPKVVPVSANNRKKRLVFAEKHEDKDEGFWDHVVWSDEVTVEACPRNKKLRVLVHCTQKYWEIPINPQVQQGGFKVTFWGAFTKHGTGPLVPVEGIVDKEKYIDLLDNYLVSEMKHLNREHGRGFLFMQDNARPHTAKKTLAFLRKEKIKILEWPPQSPDLNPIENLWAIIKRRLYSDRTMFSSKQALIDSVLHEWNNIEISVCEHLVDSMPKRLQEVFKTHGYPIKI